MVASKLILESKLCQFVGFKSSYIQNKVFEVISKKYQKMVLTGKSISDIFRFLYIISIGRYLHVNREMKIMVSTTY